MVKQASTGKARIMKYGRLVILLSGKYAGRKAVIVKVHDDQNAGRNFPHALVAGIDRYPRRVHKGLSQKKFDKKTSLCKTCKRFAEEEKRRKRRNVDTQLNHNLLCDELQSTMLCD